MKKMYEKLRTIGENRKSRSSSCKSDRSNASTRNSSTSSTCSNTSTVNNNGVTKYMDAQNNLTTCNTNAKTSNGHRSSRKGIQSGNCENSPTRNDSPQNACKCTSNSNMKQETNYKSGNSKICVESVTNCNGPNATSIVFNNNSGNTSNIMSKNSNNCNGSTDTNPEINFNNKFVCVTHNNNAATKTSTTTRQDNKQFRMSTRPLELLNGVSNNVPFTAGKILTTNEEHNNFTTTTENTSTNSNIISTGNVTEESLDDEKSGCTGRSSSDLKKLSNCCCSPKVDACSCDKDQKRNLTEDSTGFQSLCIKCRNFVIDKALWVRPLSTREKGFELSQSKHKHQITCYRLGLCSTTQITEQIMKTSLILLYRKVPHLRLFIEKGGDGQLWFREQKHDNIDLKVLHDSNVKDEIENQITTSLQSFPGPLWRAVLIPFAKDEITQMNEPISERYKLEYHLLLTFHHAITDGYTTVRVCELLLKIIDDVLHEKEVDTNEQLGVFSDGAETNRLIMKRKHHLDHHPRSKEAVIREIKKISDYRPLMSKAFPVDETLEKNTTLHRVQRFTKRETEALLSFFRFEKLSLNAGFIALVNLTLVEMFKKRGLVQNSYEICSFNAVNFRRYWDAEYRNDLGCHFGPITLITDTPIDSKTQFLEYAHDIQTNMADYLANNRVFDECMYLNLMEGTSHQNMDQFFTEPPEYPQFYHSTTNLGNLEKVFSGNGDMVKTSWLSRHNSFHRYNSTIINALHTFRGRLYFSVDYNARNITTAVVNEYMLHIYTLILDLVRQSERDNLHLKA